MNRICKRTYNNEPISEDDFLCPCRDIYEEIENDINEETYNYPKINLPFQVYMEEQFIGSYNTYEEAVAKATEDGKTGANFIGRVRDSEKETFTYTYNTPDGDEVLDFIIYFPSNTTEEKEDDEYNKIAETSINSRPDLYNTIS